MVALEKTKMRIYNNNNQNSGKLIVLNSVHQDREKNQLVPHFTESEKQPDGSWQVVRAETPLKGFGGDLIRVTPEVKEFKKDGKVVDTKESVKLLFKSGEESYLLSLTWRMASRNLFNNLLGLERFDNLKISYWRGTSGFENLSLYQNDVLVRNGLLTNDEMKEKIDKVMIKGKETSDTYRLNQYLKEELVKLNDEIAAQKPVAPSAPAAAPKVESDEESEIPF